MIVNRALFAVVAAAVLLGCPDKKPDAEKAEQDRLIMKLQEAREHEADSKGPPLQEDPNAKLAKLAAGEGGEHAVGPRPLPGKNAPVKLGTVSLELVGLETTQSVSTGKITLSTEELFLIVKLHAENTNEREQPLDFSLATLKAKGQDISLARDAQKVSGTRELSMKFGAAAGMQKADVTLVFEVPADALGSGLSLHIKSPDVDPVDLPLE